MDLIVISNGGDPTASLKIISLLREQLTKITIFIPYSAYSAATLIALGCNEIYMHPYGDLGPVDPQISIPKKNPQGIGLSFSAEDIQHYIIFIKDDIGIKKEPGLEAGLNLLCKEVSPTSIGFTRKSIKLSHSMGRKLLMMHMFNEEKVKTIIEELNSSYFNHGYPVGRKEAIRIGLPILENTDKIDKLLWEIWNNIAEESESNNSFDPLLVVINSGEGHKLIEPVNQITFPPDINILPPHIA